MQSANVRPVTPPAAQDLYRLTRYIRRDNPEAARKVAKTIYDGFESLVRFPHRGRPGIEPGARDLGFSPLPYIAIYRAREPFIEIMRIWHAAQNKNLICKYLSLRDSRCGAAGEGQHTTPQSG